jgi:hypothetical protein
MAAPTNLSEWRRRESRAPSNGHRLFPFAILCVVSAATIAPKCHRRIQTPTLPKFRGERGARKTWKQLREEAEACATCRQIVAGRVGKVSFSVQRLDLLDQRVDFFLREFTCEFGHVAFAACNNVLQVRGRCGSNFCCDERWAGEMASLGGFPVALFAVLLVDEVGGQTVIGGPSLANGDGDWRKPEQDSDGESVWFHMRSPDNMR